MSYKVCYTYEKQRVCHTVGTPIWTRQLPPWDSRGESGDGGYPGIVNDLSLIASVHNLANGISDRATQQALRSGLQSALSAIQKRGAEHGLTVSEIKVKPQPHNRIPEARCLGTPSHSFSEAFISLGSSSRSFL